MRPMPKSYSPTQNAYSTTATNKEENFKIEPIMWFRDERTINHHIIDFVHVEDKFFIGLRGSGILSVSFNKTLFIEEFYSEHLDKLVSLKVKDLQEVGKSIYVLVEGHGIKILNVTEYPFFIDYEFYHPYIIQNLGLMCIQMRGELR